MARGRFLIFAFVVLSATPAFGYFFEQQSGVMRGDRVPGESLHEQMPVRVEYWYRVRSPGGGRLHATVVGVLGDQLLNVRPRRGLELRR